MTLATSSKRTSTAAILKNGEPSKNLAFVGLRFSMVTSKKLGMCLPYYLLVPILFASVVFADDYKTLSGKEYKNATVSRVEPDGIVIKFSGGIVKIPFADLSQDLQQKY